MFRSRSSGLTLGLALVLGAIAAGAAENHKPAVDMVVEKVSLASVNSERLQLAASVSVVSPRKVTLHEVTFAQLRASGIPFYASPISERLALLPRQKAAPSKPVLLTVYLRDLNSLKPLHELLAEGKVSIRGMAYADLDMTPAEKLFLLAGHARVPVQVNNTVELGIPGGPMAKTAALALIDYGQAALERSGSAWQAAVKLFSQRRQKLWEEYEPVLVLARATYQLQDNTGKSVSLENTGMGFRVGGKQVVVPKALLEPWKFDPYVAAGMKQGNLKVSGYDLVLWPANAHLRDDAGQLSLAHAWSLSGRQIRLLTATKDENEPALVPVTDGRPVKVSVHRRESPAALGLVEIVDSAVPPMSPVLAPGEAASPGLNRDAGSFHPNAPKAGALGTPLAAFRFPEGTGSGEAKPELVLLSARQEASGLVLDTPVDSTGWGSPLISDKGIVGVIMNENFVVSIAEAGKALNFRTSPPGNEGAR